MLSINNLHVAVDNKEIVKGVSLTVRPGEIHALMGPNGSGKSSLALALAGHPRYKVSKSEIINHKSYITLDGVDIANKTPDERARMGLFLALQYPVGVGGVTVEQLLRRSVQEIKNQKSKIKNDIQNSEFRIQNSKLDVLQFRKDLEKLAKKVGVKPELLRRAINVGFSGGEKKRLEVLQMLVLKPQYAILDETDSGLDVDALRTIAKNIRLFANSNLKTQNSKPQLKTQKLPGILVITHYARILHYLKPDFVHIMKDGQITETGGKELAERIEKKGYGEKFKVQNSKFKA